MALEKKITVPLDRIIDAIDRVNDMCDLYLDVETMEVIMHSDGAYYGGDIEEEDDPESVIEEGLGKRFFALPDSFDIDDYSVMRRFADDLPDGVVRSSLAMALNGKGEFRRFRETIARYGLTQKWYDFLSASHRDCAIEWCNENGLSYKE